MPLNGAINVIAAADAPRENTVKHFTINAENNITVHASRETARKTDAGAFATAEQFADLIGPHNKRLIEIWNSLPGVKAVAKLTSRKTATEHIWRAVQDIGDAAPAATVGDEPVAAAPVAPQTPNVAPVEAPAKTSVGKTEGGSRRIGERPSRDVSRVLEHFGAGFESR